MNTPSSTPLSSAVSYTVTGAVATIRLDNPPVNALGDSVRTRLYEAITLAGSDREVRAVIIDGAGNGFCGGADLRQFDTPAAATEPALAKVFAAIRQMPKPVIAAIHGFAFGGGLELALVCHYRIAHRSARIGLPEVHVGVIPGAGGTQRLPRLIGADRALTMIQQGTTVTGSNAHALGIVDVVCDCSPTAAALDFVDSGRVVSPPPVIDDLPPASPDGADFAAARRRVRGNTRNGRAQMAAISAVEASTRTPIQDGLLYERRVFDELLQGPESAALRHSFFAEKEAAKIVDLPSNTPTRRIDRVAVIGAGTMGSGIAMAFANSNLAVTLIEREETALMQGIERIRHNYAVTESKGKITKEEAAERLSRIKSSLDLAAAGDADLIVEAAFEDMAVKRELFASLDSLAKPGAILATNTSRLDINEIAAATARPQDVVGLHFFSPANVMKLLEVVRSDTTALDVIATSMQLAQRIDKVPVLARVGDGFIGNRMLSPYRRESDFLLEEGASPQQVDTALQSFGMAMGPCAMADLAGLDIGWAARKRLAPHRAADARYSKVADRICEAGRFGQKTGKGYYRYAAGNRTPHADPIVDEIILDCAAQAGIARRAISDEEIVDRTILALVNEGARLLGEGIAQRGSDIDAVYVHGYGFPAYRGGPMYYAETLGLDVTLVKIRRLHETHGETWSPAPLLEELVNRNHTRF